ncbi:telomere-associated protein RIF1 isoform X1 [Zootoca vivipara]|uniref:telomere-associated protein RIF1 isoform X1 n=2 Tax=Zootoca vivipara TaxID=8524 RepID=UPI0015907068|nr:telomere-associated protein RIF1 isoform X1 [Zootoca vivipara]
MSGADSTTGPCPSGSLRPLLETLEDPAAAPAALTDALLTLTNRLTGEEGKEFASEVGKLFPQLYKIFKTYIPTENSELSSAALQALGFCVFNSKTAALLCESEIQELLSIVNSVAIKAVDKNTRTRALWVISKQSFPSDIVGKLVPSIIGMLETVLNKGDLHSMVVEYEALNVIIRLIEQAPSHMEEQAVKWAKLIIPLVVHSAHKVQLRGATALEMGVPLLLQKQQEVAAVTEELMTTKIIPELQKLFASKNETYVLKLWPLFIKLLGKALHRSGSFINSLLQLEELGFRSGSPVVKKIAFIAWKSLIDNFALNPDILCSAKRLKLLMQPLSSIHVRTEALALTKLEVWWYLLMRLGPHLPAHFEQVCVPLIQSTLSLDPILQQGNSSRLAINQSLLSPGSAHKSGAFPIGTPANKRMNLSSSSGVTAIPSIQLLGIEMLLHFFMGPEVLSFSKENNIALSLEPLQHSVITSPSFFCKHASTFINAVQDGFIAVGKDASDTSLSAIWKEMIRFVKGAIESGSKRERQSSDVLTMLLQALKNIVVSNELSVLKSMSLIEITIKELPPKVLGSPAYQVADMDLLNGTPALFLIQLSFHEELLKCYVQDERFFLNYESLVGCVLSGPTSPLTFSESVFTIVNQSAKYLENKEHLWRMWSIIVNPLTEWINQTNEVNQGDALEHNFSAIYSALLLPVNTIFPCSEFPQPTMKTLLRSWSELYRAFARCALLVGTAEDNLCCEELSAKIISGLEDEADINQSKLDGLAHITSVMVDCINFAPYGNKYQPSNRSPQMPADWSKKKKDPLGKLSSLIKLLVILVNSLQMIASKESSPERKTSISTSVIGALQNIIGHISLPSVIRPLFRTIAKPLSAFYEKTKSTNASKVTNGLNNKFEKLLAESISCFQSFYAGSFDSELLQELSPLLCIMLLHKNKQLRSQAAQFWNATFGKAVVLTYPEELKCVLCQAKQKNLLSLPGFENTDIVGECNGTYSDSQTENSQWDAKISGIEVNPSGKRDSLLAQTNELKPKSINSPVTPAKQMKLENSLTKTNRKNLLLEEENTVDFVIIPPETKERVLTEHQKEVLRTKRIDIPTMYNNLDASQDTTLFSQYSQSQEDYPDKPASVEESEREENKTIPQDEKAASDLLGIAHEVTESGKTDVLPEKNNSTNAEQLTTFGKQSLDPNCEKLETCAPKSDPGETSVLDYSLNECTSNVSSCSSASSDVISGTPQPVSRRQSFITLEKFNSSENRPFSPTTFTVSGTSASTPLLTKQECMIASDASFKGIPDGEDNNSFKHKVEEAIPRSKRSNLEILGALETYVKVKRLKEENKANSKLQPESTLGIKKSSLRQNKTDNSEEENSKIPQLHQEKNMQESPANLVEDKCELPGETQEPEYLLDIPSQVSELNALGCTVENKQILDNVAETKAGANLDSKENTPPELTLAAATISNVGQSPQVSPNPKALRRSLRRKPETAEGASGSPDKENSQQKKDGRKDGEKVLPKRSSQSKEASAQKQKSVPDKTIDVQGSIKKEINVHGSRTAEGTILKESHVSRTIQEETSITNEKSEGSHSSDISDLQDSVPDTTGEKPKGFPRYQTRRTSQGLLTSIENSESDGSETKEEGTKRKRLGRWKNKSSSLESSSIESHMKEVLESQEFHAKPATEIQTMPAENKDVMHSDEHMEIALVSGVIGQERERSTLPLSECSGLEQDMDISLCRDSSDTERTAARMLTRSTSESARESRQRTTVMDKYSDSSCNISSPAEGLESGAYTAAISASSSPEKSSETTECQHKRSKRTRKSKSCNCCGEKPSPQLGKSNTEIKKEGSPQKEGSPELKLKEPKKMANKATVALPSIPATVDSQFAERLSMEPFAASTPLSSISNSSALKDSHEGIQSEDDLLGGDTPKEELKKSSHVKDESDTSVAENLDCVGLAEGTSEPSSIDSDLVEHIVQCPSLKADTDPGSVKIGDSNQSGHPEGRTDVEMSVNQPEKTKASETKADIIQNVVDKTPVSVAEVPELQEQDAESDIASRSIEHEISALVQKENSSDSPLKFQEIYALSVAKISESPNGVQARCIWSPSASPSTSILKRGVKRQKEEDSPSPANKSRRVSFANPIYQEELADDIDRRSPVVRTHSSNGSQSFRSIKSSPNHQAKLITTPTKGSLSPGSRSHKYKSSKKCLIPEMVKDPLPSPTECIYPALVGCKAPVDTILPQITSNIWARGLGQLIRAKNIRTVGDLSSLTSAEIKTLPIRSPKVSNVKRALKGYHDQQVRSRGFEENAGLDDVEKPVNGIDEKSCSTNEDKMETDLSEPVSSTADEQSTTDLFAQLDILAPQFTSENLLNYSGSELFEMQEKLYSMTNCIMKNLQARWKSPTRESTV